MDSGVNSANTMSDTCYIFFRPGKATLESAESSLMEYGLTVDRADGRLVVHLPGSPSFMVRLANAEHVQAEAAGVGAGTEHEAEMSACTERFEIEIEDLAEALDEINTLMEIQWALQEASGGFLFLPWNASLSKP